MTATARWASDGPFSAATLNSIRENITMPFALSGLFTYPEWRVYPTKQEAAPGPGVHAVAAFTDTRWKPTSFSVQPVPGSSPTVYRLEGFEVEIALKRTASWKKSWLSTKSSTFQADLLNHEHGHYKITAFSARDYFVDVMLMKHQTFSTAQACLDAVNALKAETVDLIGAIDTLYDTEVHPEQAQGLSNGPIQQRWDGYFQTTRTSARASGTQAPDGTAHKQRLVDVLRADNKTIP